MKKVLGLLVLVFSVFVLSSCDFLFIEEEEDKIVYDLNEYTRQELIDLVEELMEESYHKVEYDLDSFEAAATEMLMQRQETVVGIRVGTTLQSGTASGVIYRKSGNDYYVVTNHHVIHPDERAIPFSNVQIIYERNGMRFTIDNTNTEIMGLDATTDLAVIKFSSNQNFPVAEFADSYDLSVGQFVFAVGNPLGFDYFGSVTMGVISGLARFVPTSQYEVPFLQHDAAISPRNSGGGLFDINGKLIGINNMKIVEDATTNINFAIPSNTVLRIITELETEGEVQRPYFGIQAASGISDCGQEYGVCISAVATDGTAIDTGLLAGDIIIGYKLETWDSYIDVYNFNDLREAILNSQVGDNVSVKYIRGDQVYESIYVPLVIHPDDR